MIYLDNAATTKPLKEVLDTFLTVSNKYYANSNSLHDLGSKSSSLMNAALFQIGEILKAKNNELIITSSATEANNLAIKGIVEAYPLRGKHIITTKLEHASISETLKYLEKKGYEISYVNLKNDGKVNLDDLKSKIKKETILVSIVGVDSELGIIQPIKEIYEIVKTNKTTFFHTDATQMLGKFEVDSSYADLISFSAHKINGLKGTGLLYKSERIKLEPIIHGGKSQALERSGTPMLPQIVAFSKAIRLAVENIEEKKKHVTKLNDMLRTGLTKYELSIKIITTTVIV